MLVMKFGGSLLGSRGGIARVARIVRESARENRVVVVVSALGDVTDALLGAASNAKEWDANKITHLLEGIRAMHKGPVEGLGLSSAEKDAVFAQVELLLEELKVTLTGISLLRELTPRSTDLVLSIGERLSGALVAAALESAGLDVRGLTGGEAGIVTDENYGEAKPLPSRTRSGVRSKLLPLLRKRVIPIVTGFIARSSNGEMTTLGRGGSDYTATLLGQAIGSDEVWIWTDVDGILSADPRVVRDARVIEELSYTEAEEMGFFGAKNMHPLALGPARKTGMPVRIKNGFKPALPGTLIHAKERKSRSIAKSVAVVNHVAMITVCGESLVGRPGTAAQVFGILGDAGVNILMISQSVSESNISAVVRRGAVERATSALKLGLSRAGIFAAVRSEPGVSVIAVIGSGMYGTPGVAAKIFSAVASRGVNVRMIAQGSSELNVSFVVAAKDAVRAVKALHEALVLKK